MIRKAQKKKPISRSENMARIRAQNTAIEQSLRKELWRRGLRYRKNDKTVFGKPDIVFKTLKIAVFCDSEFWHGKKYLKGEIPKRNRDFWIKKFENNIKRDNLVNKRLRKSGWTVIRIWETDIKKNVKKCANRIEATIKKVRGQSDLH